MTLTDDSEGKYRVVEPSTGMCIEIQTHRVSRGVRGSSNRTSDLAMTVSSDIKIIIWQEKKYIPYGIR